MFPFKMRPCPSPIPNSTLPITLNLENQIKSNQIYSWHKIITGQQDTKAGNPTLTDALETVRQKLSKIHNATTSVINVDSNNVDR